MFATTKIKFLAPLFAFLFSLCQPPTAPPPPPVITILTYHTFDSPIKTPYSVASRRFNEQMRFLAVQKIPVIPLALLTDYLHGKAELPERSVVITIDDGYKTAATIAEPILRRYHFPFTLYVYPYAIGHLRGNLTWKEVQDLDQRGVDIESHSLTHPLLTHPGKPMNKKDFEAWIDHELVESKRTLEFELKHRVSSLAYPYGGYDEYSVERTRMAGYETALTCDDGDVAKETDPLRLNRRLVFRQTSLKEYSRFFAQLPILLADLSPRDGERVDRIPAAITARIGNLGDILPGSAQLLVDKLGSGWHEVPIDPKTGVMRYPIPNAKKRGYYFVSLVAKDRLHPSIKREATWLFIVKRNVSKK